MEQGARVHTIDAVREFRGRLIEFSERAVEALSEAEFEIRRTLDWLRHEQTAYWKHEIARNTKALETARSELFRAEVNAQQNRSSARDERARVKKLQQRIQQAEQKLVTIGKWIKTLEQEMSTYRAGCNGLSALTAGELPKAADELKQMAAQLDRYVKAGGPPPKKSAADVDADSADEQAGDDEQST